MARLRSLLDPNGSAGAHTGPGGPSRGTAALPFATETLSSGGGVRRRGSQPPGNRPEPHPPVPPQTPAPGGDGPTPEADAPGPSARSDSSSPDSVSTDSVSTDSTSTDRGDLCGDLCALPVVVVSRPEGETEPTDEPELEGVTGSAALGLTDAEADVGPRCYGGVPCAVHALCARCAKSWPFSTTGSSVSSED